MTLAITLGKAAYIWRDAFTGMKNIYKAGGLYHFNQRVPLSVEGGVPPTLRRARHIPVPHHVQNLKWFKQCMRNHWISFRNATWSKVSRNSRSIHSIHITQKKTSRDIPSTFQRVSHPAQRVETSSHSFGTKGGFPKGLRPFPWRTRLVLGPPTPVVPQFTPRCRVDRRKKTVKYLIQVLGTDSFEVHSPKCGYSFKLSSINQARESIRTKVIDEYLWHLPQKYRSL